MAINNDDIKISPQEEQAIKDNDPTNIPIDATNQGWTGDQVRAQMAASITANQGSVLSELKEKTGLIADKFDEVDANMTSRDNDVDTLQTDVTNLENLVDTKVNRSGDTMTGDLNMDTNDIVTEGSINATTFENGDNASDAVVFNNFVSLFDLDTLIASELEKQPDENYLEYYTRLLELKFSDIQSAEELALTFLRRSGVDPMTGDLDLGGNAITNVGDIEDLETEINTRVPQTRTIAGLDLIDDITVGEIKTAIGEATESLSGLMSASDKQELAVLTALLDQSDADVDTVVDTIGELLEIFQNYPEGVNVYEELQSKVDKIEGYGLSQNDFTDALKTKLDALNVDAEENVQSDWDESDINSDAYIQNKPSIYEQTTIDTLLAGKVNVGELNSNITLYPTNTYEVGGTFDGYAQMVTEISDARYNDTEVILYTTDDRLETGDSVIVSTDPNNPNLVGALVSDVGLLIGDVGIINTTTLGQVRKVSGNSNENALLRYKIFKSDDMVNPIAISSYTDEVTNETFVDLFQSANLNNGVFTETDRIVIHYEAYATAGTPIIAIIFGGSDPTRTLLPVPLNVIQSAKLIKYDNTTSGLTALNVQDAIDEVKGDIPTNNNELTNGAGYITDYTVTSGDVTQHEADLTIAQSQVTNLTNDLAAKADLVNGKVPINQIPLQFDDVLQGYFNVGDGEFYQEATFENLIVGGNAEGKLYIDIASNSIYRFEGSAYAPVITIDEITYGTVAGTAYEGNNGQANADAISVLQPIVSSNTTNIGTNTTTLSEIIDGTTVVAKSTSDANGNNIVDTYATKVELNNSTIDTLDEIVDVNSGATALQFLQRNAENTAWGGATVNKTTVGLENVQNYGIATQAEAEAGLVDNEYMTPLKTKQAIAALVPPSDEIIINDKPVGFALNNTIYDNKSFSVASQDVEPRSFDFSEDGTKLFVGFSAGTGVSNIFQYNLSTPWDVSTASYSGVGYDTSAQAGVVYGLAFGDNGNKMYISDYSNIKQYTLSTPYDLTQVTYDNKTIYRSNVNSYEGIAFSKDGTKIYSVTPDEDKIYQWDLSTPWDISTGPQYNVPTFELSISSRDTAPWGLAISNDGTKIFFTGLTSDRVHQYNMSTPWELSTATFSGISYSHSGIVGSATGVKFSYDGNKMYLSDYNNDRIYQYSTSGFEEQTLAFNKSDKDTYEGLTLDQDTLYIEPDFVGIKATQEEAEAGTNDTYLMTPLKTKQAIQELAPAPDLTGYATETFVNNALANLDEVIVSETEPASPQEGDLWFDSTELVLYIYYNDGQSLQWVSVNEGAVAPAVSTIQNANTSSSETDIGVYYDNYPQIIFDTRTDYFSNYITQEQIYSYSVSLPPNWQNTIITEVDGEIVWSLGQGGVNTGWFAVLVNNQYVKVTNNNLDNTEFRFYSDRVEVVRLGSDVFNMKIKVYIPSLSSLGKIIAYPGM